MYRVWRGVRDAFAPQIDPHATSFLGRRFAGLPGPIWSLLAWNLVMVLVTALNVLALASTHELTSSRIAMVAYCAGMSVDVRLLGSRLPVWSLHLLVDLNILAICFTAGTALNGLRAASTLTFLMLPTVYAATWMDRRQMGAHLIVILLGSALVVGHLGVSPDTVRVWITLMAVCTGLGYFVNALVRHLNEQASIDPLTGLLNRSGLDQVEGAQSRAGAAVQPRTVVVLDLDGFKDVNDTLGHGAGDELLRRVGATMRAHLRPNDTVTRTGGDEFVILLSRTEVTRARAIVGRLVDALPIGASFGIAPWPDGMAMDEALRSADGQMYRQKGQRKRDRV